MLRWASCYFRSVHVTSRERRTKEDGELTEWIRSERIFACQGTCKESSWNRHFNCERFHMNYPMGSNMGDNDVTITNEEAMKNKNREGGGCAAYVGLDGRCRYG